MSQLPNIRKMFVPFPANTFFDIDLDSADLRTVAWESDCQLIKSMFREGKKPYIEMGKEYYRDPTFSKYKPDGSENLDYTRFKSLCHGTNYLGKAANISGRIGLLVSDCERVQKWYLGACPEIGAWHDRIIKQMDRTATVSNAFGYRRKFFDRVEGTVYNEAVAWIGQSTTSLVINHGLVAIDEFEEANHWGILLNLQVHDSLVGQFPTIDRERCEAKVRELTTITVPYPDPFVLPIGIKTSAISWGDCQG